jgi:membrane protease YdiL (CAAX protease family)
LQRPEEASKKETQDAAVGIGPIHAPQVSEFILLGKLVFFLRDVFQQAATAGGPSPSEDPSAAIVSMSDQFAGWTGANPDYPASVDNLPHLKKGEDPSPAADRLRAAILAGEVLDKDELRWRIEDVEHSLDPSSPLHDDTRIVRAIYGLPPAQPPPDANSPKQDADAALTTPTSLVLPKVHTPTDEELAASHKAVLALSDADKKSFREHSGWFADLALSRGDKSSTLRESAASDGLILLLFFCFIGFVVFVAGLVGLILLIVAFVRLGSGRIKWAFTRPNLPTEWPTAEEQAHDPYANPFPRRIPFATPGSVWLETVAVFFAMFLGIKVIVGAVGAALHWGPDVKTAALLGGQWLVALSIFWPILRGMPLARWKKEIGWSAPRGVFREIGAGICGYLAGLPVYFGVAIIVVGITWAISHLTGGSEPRAVGNRLTDVLEGGTPWELAVIFMLATIWAPVVEESIFRGCLFRHLRRRVGLILAALGSAAVFAALHGYLVQQLFMVAALGFWFALMREWRGNIIATATAHALHNGFVMSIVLFTLSFARG